MYIVYLGSVKALVRSTSKYWLFTIPMFYWSYHLEEIVCEIWMFSGILTVTTHISVMHIQNKIRALCIRPPKYNTSLKLSTALVTF